MIHASAALSCPGCGRQLDAHMNVSDKIAAPSDGEVSLCAHCSTISLYTTVNGGLVLRLPADTELDDILRDPTVQKAITAVRIVRERGAL